MGRRDEPWLSCFSLNRIHFTYSCCDYMMCGLSYCILVKQQKLELSPFLLQKVSF